jgi:hypothetical protein
LGQVISIIVARFLCLACRCTVSYLPSFALSYRLVNAQTVDAFLQGELQRDDVQRNQEILQTYRRRILAFAPALIAAVGAGLGVAPPERPPVWDWIGVWKFDGSHTPVGNQLQNHFIPSIPMSSDPTSALLKTPG